MDDVDTALIIGAYNFRQQENDTFVSMLVASEDGVPSITGNENDGEKNEPAKGNAVAESKSDYVWTMGKALLE